MRPNANSESNAQSTPSSTETRGFKSTGAVRKSTRTKGQSIIVANLDKDSQMAEADKTKAYEKIVAEARRVAGYGDVKGVFPAEWEHQLLLPAGETTSGEEIVFFCPAFLKSVKDDRDELDTAFRFMLLRMDKIAMKVDHKYSLVLCPNLMDWSLPELVERFRFTYDILPRRYSKNLQNLYVLHPSAALRFTFWTMWPWMSSKVWNKIEYVDNLDVLCNLLFPEDIKRRVELTKHFPLMVQRMDAEMCGRELPLVFGVPLKQLSDTFGAEYTDQATTRLYQNLPCALIFLCEAMEREGGSREDFDSMFHVKLPEVRQLIEDIENGHPMQREVPVSALWCVLKLFVDCLPTPLLTFDALRDLRFANIKPGDQEAQGKILLELLTQRLPVERAHFTLYLAHFLKTRCEKAEGSGWSLTPADCANAFASGFLRPRHMTPDAMEDVPGIISFVETLIKTSNRTDFWVGKLDVPRWLSHVPADSGDPSNFRIEDDDTSDEDSAGSAVEEKDSAAASASTNATTTNR